MVLIPTLEYLPFSVRMTLIRPIVPENKRAHEIHFIKITSTSTNDKPYGHCDLKRYPMEKLDLIVLDSSSEGSDINDEEDDNDKWPTVSQTPNFRNTVRLPQGSEDDSIQRILQNGFIQRAPSTDLSLTKFAPIAIAPNLIAQAQESGSSDLFQLFPERPIAYPKSNKMNSLHQNPETPENLTPRPDRPIAYPSTSRMNSLLSLPLSVQQTKFNGRLDSLKSNSVVDTTFDFRPTYSRPLYVPSIPSGVLKPQMEATQAAPNIISLSSDEDTDMESYTEEVSNVDPYNNDTRKLPSYNHLTNGLQVNDSSIPLVISLPQMYSAQHSNTSSVLIIGDNSHSPGMKPPNTDMPPLNRGNEPLNVESDDEEIVILDPQTANKATTYKKSTFEMYPRSPSPPRMPGLFPVAPSNHNVPIAAPHVDESFSKDQLERQELESRLGLIEQERSALSKKIQSFTRMMQENLKLFQDASMQLELIRNEYDKVRRTGGVKLTLKSIKSRLEQKEVDYHNAQSGYTNASVELDTIKRKKSSLDNSSNQIVRKLMSYVNVADQFRNAIMNSNNSRQPPPTYEPNIYSSQNNELTETEMKAWMSSMYDEEEVDDTKLPQTPSEMKVTLMKHQRRGLAWLVEMEKNTFKGGILADDMGLGKTVQTIALMLHNKATSPNRRTTLIIAPVSLLKQWAQEIESKINEESQLTIGFFHGNEKKYLKKFEDLNKRDVVLTSYGTLASEWKKHFKEAIEQSKVSKKQNVLPDLNSGGRSYVSPFFSKEAVFNRIILDEAQAIKNKLSLNAKSVTCLKAEFRFILTGTPMQNSVGELYPFFRFLKARPYNNEERFNQEIAMPLKLNDQWEASQKELGLKKLRAILRALVLRRTKDSKIDGKPILQLPPLHINSELLLMEKEENDYYFGLQSDIQVEAKKLLEEKKAGVGSGILTLLLRLRQACCHRFLVDVGQMNAYEKEHMEAAKGEERTIIQKCMEIKSLPKEVSDTVLREYGQEEDDGMFSCPMCAMLNPSTSMLIFIKCGHMICRDCVDDFFERYLTLDPFATSKKATCMKCQAEVEEDKMLSHSLFYDTVVKEMPIDEVVKRQIASSTTTMTLTRQKVKELIEANGGIVKSAKMTKTLELINDILVKKPGEKIIVFSQFLVSFEVLAVSLQEKNIQFLRYDGTMSIDEKNLTVKQFYQSEIPILLLSLKAGNVGLTLTCASQVILMEPFWNPFPEDQAIGRAHRIGQNRDVQVYRLLTPGTVESRIVELQKRKKELAEAALDEDGLRSISRLGRQELGFLFGFNSLGNAQ